MTTTTTTIIIATAALVVAAVAFSDLLLHRRIQAERDRARWIESCLRSSLVETIHALDKVQQGNGSREAARVVAAAHAELAALEEDRDHWERRARALEAGQQP